MAKLQGPLHSDHAKGSVSGVTYREFRGLPTATRRPRPVRRVRRTQTNIRSILAYLARKWGDLSATARALWAEWAATHPIPDGFGGTFQLDGNQAFIMLNHTAIRMFGAAGENELPPTEDSPATCDTLVAGDVIPGGFTLTWTHLGAPIAADLNEVRLAGPFMSPGRTSVENRYRYYSDVPGINVQKAINGLVEGAWYWAKVRYVPTSGMRTNWVRAQVKTGITPP